MLLTEQHKKSYENAKICYICKENFKNKYFQDKKYCKVRDHCHYTEEYRGAGHSICNLKYSVPKKTASLNFQNGSNCNYHFIIKELAEEFKKQFTCLEENTEKYITFTVQQKKVTRIDKNGKEVTKNISYILQFTIGQDLWHAHYQTLLTLSGRSIFTPRVQSKFKLFYLTSLEQG